MKKITYILIYLLQANFFFAQSINSNHIDSIINKYAKEYSIVGLSIGTVYKDSIETKSYGTTNLDSKSEITESTLFNIASITKLFTATAIMQLVKEGKLALDDKVVDILPEFKMKDKRFKEITVYHLLTHSSGLMWDNKLKNSPNNETSLPLYLKNLEKKKLNFKPGSKMSYETYSNVAFDLLGIIIEKIANQSYEDFIQKNQLDKLGLSNSTFKYKLGNPNIALPQIVAGNSKGINRLNFQGVDSKKKPIINGEPLQLVNYDKIGEDYEHNPSGNLMSSTSELCTWLNELLKTNKDSSNYKILSKASLDKMWDNNYLAHKDNIFIGLGWWIKEDENFGRSYFHVGTNPGYCSILMIYPEQDLGIAILSNGWYAKDAIWKKIFNEIVKVYHSE